MKQTAVEWYAEQSMRLELERAKGNISINEMLNQLSNVLEKAKEMEKEQIGKAFLNGRIKEIGQGVLFDLQPLKETFDNYYNETYESKTNL